MNKIKIFRPFQLKVTFALILSMLFALLLSNFLISRSILQSEFQTIRQQLMDYAQLASMNINPETLKQVPLNHEGVKTREYQALVEVLRNIKEINPRIAYIYILTKTKKDGIFQFMVDPNPAARRGDDLITSLPGDEYDAARFPAMMKGYQEPSADSDLEVDEWGVTLSGYAPIRDVHGQSIAMLGVDILANDIYQLQKETQDRVLYIFILGFLFSIFLGMVIARRITDPVEKLVDGARRIADGDLLYAVKVKGNNEITQLADEFNQMTQSLYESRRKLVGYFYGVIRSLINVLEAKDQYTRNHSEKVAKYAMKIASKMGFSRSTVKLIKRISLLHDVGKLAIHDGILNKTDQLTEEEWGIIRGHPLTGVDILKPVLFDQEMLSIVLHHHERYDGNGYPDHLKGDEINLLTAIVSVADAYDAMTTDRIYRKGMTKQQAMAELEKERGRQFHPKVVDVFLGILKSEK